MNKSKKIMGIFILVVALVLLAVNCSNATNVPVINIGGNNTANNTTNNTASNTVNNTAKNNVQINNAVKNNTVNTNTANNTQLPKTGIEENTLLVVFIGVAVVSAVYAYVRIKKYNNI